MLALDVNWSQEWEVVPVGAPDAWLQRLWDPWPVHNEATSVPVHLNYTTDGAGGAGIVCLSQCL